MWKKVLKRTILVLLVLAIVAPIMWKLLFSVPMVMCLKPPIVWFVIPVAVFYLYYLVDTMYDYESLRKLKKVIKKLESRRHNYIFKKEGPQKWRVKFRDEICILDNFKGVQYIALLLARKNEEISAVELYKTACGTGRDNPNIFQGSQEITDKNCLEECENTLAELWEDKEQAEKVRNTTGAELVQKQIDEITSQLNSTKGLGGQLRKFSNEAEKARVSVTQAINRVLKSIKKEYPKLWTHLNKSIYTGATCSYKPNKEVYWRLKQ